jgi:hypothetical protein
MLPPCVQLAGRPDVFHELRDPHHQHQIDTGLRRCAFLPWLPRRRPRPRRSFARSAGPPIRGNTSLSNSGDPSPMRRDSLRRTASSSRGRVHQSHRPSLPSGTPIGRTASRCHGVVATAGLYEVEHALRGVQAKTPVRLPLRLVVELVRVLSCGKAVFLSCIAGRRAARRR